MRKLVCHLSLISGSLSFAVSTYGQQQPIRIEAGFEPAAITLSHQTTYKVTIHGSQQSPEGRLPQVDGLGISNNQRVFRSASYINGVPSVRLDISFTAKPNRVGTFTVPAWSLSIGGQLVTVPAATLRALPLSQEDILREEGRKKQEADLSQALFLELSLPRDYLYEGQTVLGSINLFIWERLPVTRFEQLPQKLGEAFSQSEINQPVEKRTVSRNGKTYHLYSWPVAITAVMEGNHDLQYVMAVRVRVERERTSPFSSPFFSDPFFGFGQEKAISVTSEKRSIEVRPLPMDGRPPSFRGAIGSFQTQTDKDNAHVTVGDPIRITFSVTGKGNFGVIPAPELPSNDKIKIGPPAFLFEGDENLKYEGTQKFEYVVTPLRLGRLEIPAVPFSYFDPVNQNYVVASTESQTIRVDPGETWVDPHPIETVAANEEQSFKPARNLFQTEPEPGNWESTLAPSSVFKSSTFWYAQIAPVFCFCALLGWRLRESRSSKDSLARRLAKLRGEMKAACRSNDSSAFLRAARGTIRERVGALVNHDRPDALARDEVLDILRKNEIADETLSEVRDVLETVDTREFAGDDNGNLPLKEWLGRVNRLLKRIPDRA